MSDSDRTFVDLCLAGEVLLEEIDDFIDDWHRNPKGRELHDHLGMNWQEYSVWMNEPDLLPMIVKARRERSNLQEVLEGLALLPAAARSYDPEKARSVMEWLRRQGKLS
jgi:hypothetical protein